MRVERQLKGRDTICRVWGYTIGREWETVGRNRETDGRGCVTVGLERETVVRVWETVSMEERQTVGGGGRETVKLSRQIVEGGRR
jgi:hypothetical protein